MKYLDHGFYMISRRMACRLAAQYPARYTGEPLKGIPYRMRKIPHAGRQLLVEHDGKRWWLQETPVNGKLVWSIHEADILPQFIAAERMMP
jgi:hypothetical protein